MAESDSDPDDNIVLARLAENIRTHRRNIEEIDSESDIDVVNDRDNDFNPDSGEESSDEDAAVRAAPTQQQQQQHAPGQNVENGADKTLKVMNVVP